MELCDVLQNISDAVQDYTSINYGGCCLFSYFISKELEKRAIPFKIVLGDYYLKSPSNYVDQSKGLTEGCSAYHVFLEIGNFYYDSEGIDSTLTLLFEDENLLYFKWSSKQILTFYKRGDWNTQFKNDISEADILNIKQIIRNRFKLYDKNSIRY